ncbi:SWIM zinc finger family protein [Lentzea sp. BCCO 10_0061]|uniref:SWIM zinc finger family protein n=1 Tax=Lentzea sokolovensis TaxID=3095429 RepID=A0ABU4UMF9_9PSEU|nr:SWIM zinc finger family protein [Lentzea sp. BCCO 10_0061]MDX8140681.1 SWIM zinc finger family protein [Lentzea sp. BCCO 10_0061]
MTRPDLMALTPDALAALANRGLVKRAVKELDAGVVPALDTDPAGAVQGKFPDGTTTTLPPGIALDAARCSCGAAGVCRHRIAVVLAYQRTQETTAPAELWSPGAVTDTDLVALMGERTLRRARRAFQAGYRAKLRRPAAEDHTAQAELPTCTVTFLVPGDLSYVHTDAVNKDEATALAVWAFREADAQGADTVDVGGSPTTATDLTAVTDLLDQLLLDGATNASEVLDVAWQRLHRDLTAQRLHWPAAVITDLLAQLTAYRRRSADYEAEQFAALLTELHARTTATGPRAEILGPDEPAETPLKRVRLTALGARLRAENAADVYFASGDVVLVQRDTPLRTGVRLAASNVVSESATRSASRAVTLKTSRVAKTSLTPVGTAWDHLPQALVIDDYAKAAAHLAELPPRQVRARVEAELVRAIRVTEVSGLAYDPAAQRLTATLHDPTGTSCLLEATHRAVAPQSLDALTAALRANPTTITGSVRRHRGTLVVDPLAVHTPAGVVVVDLATDTTPQPLSPGVTTSDPLSAAVDSALTVLAEASHRGLDHLTDSLLTRVREVGAHLHRTGLRTAAASVTAFADGPASATWLAAHLRLLVTADSR